MARCTTTLEWEVAHDERVWASLNSQTDRTETADVTVAAQSTAQAYPRRRLVLTSAIGLVSFFLLLAGFLLWRQARAAYQQIEAAIQETVALEAWSTQTGNHAVGAALVDANTASDWRTQLAHEPLPYIGARSSHRGTILDVVLQDDLAMVTLRLDQGGAGPAGAYRATRFYRAVDGAWLRTLPAAQFWGPTQTLETASFVFHYRHRDREAVLAAAARVDTIYAQLRRDLTLEATPSGKMRIDVVMNLPTRAYFQVEQGRISVLSPLLQNIPQNESDADILTHSIVQQLARHSMHQALKREAIAVEWISLLQGIQLWQASAGSDSLPQWQTEMSRWLYHDAGMIRREEREPTNRDLALLCRAHVIWKHTLPMSLSPSSLCTEATWRLRLQYMKSAPQTLQELVYLADSEYRRDEQANIWIDRVAVVTVIEYLVQTYGREQIPVLMAGMRQHDTWAELAPAVVGVAAEEFEVGWLSYVDSLSTHAGLE